MHEACVSCPQQAVVWLAEQELAPTGHIVNDVPLKIVHLQLKLALSSSSSKQAPQRHLPAWM